MLGASPTSLSASAQYSGSLVNWSQATQLHFSMSTFCGRRISAGEKTLRPPPIASMAMRDQPSISAA